MTQKTYWVMSVTASRFGAVRGYDVAFRNPNYGTAQIIASFRPQQWISLENAKVKAEELAALLNGEIEPLPHDAFRNWQPGQLFRPVED
jgi:hypothetical protein